MGRGGDIVLPLLLFISCSTLHCPDLISSSLSVNVRLTQLGGILALSYRKNIQNIKYFNENLRQTKNMTDLSFTYIIHLLISYSHFFRACSHFQEIVPSLYELLSFFYSYSLQTGLMSTHCWVPVKLQFSDRGRRLCLPR